MQLLKTNGMRRFLLAINTSLFLFSLLSKAEGQTTQTVSNGAATAPVIFPGTGCTYNWVNNTPGIGLAASGTGNIPSFTAINTCNTPVTGTFTATSLPSGIAYIDYSGFAGNGTVSAIDIANNTVIVTIPVGITPWDVSVSPNGSFVYVTNLNSGNVSVISTASNTVVSTVTVGTDPQGVIVSPDENTIYVANYSSNTVSVINAATNTVIAAIPVGSGPFGITESPDGSAVYVTNTETQSSTVSAINTATNTVVSTIPVGVTPEGVSVSPDGSMIYVANTSSNSVSVINTATNTAIPTELFIC